MQLYEPEPMEIAIAMIPVIVVLGVLLLAALAIWRRAKLHEMAHRERMAMIDKGLVPPPEASMIDQLAGRGGDRGAQVASEALESLPPQVRYRSLGVMIIGLGVALIFVISVAGQSSRVGIGVGGAVIAVGIALVINAYLGGRPARTSRVEQLKIQPPAEQPPAL